jgi:integrase
MPRIAKELSAVEVSRLKKPGLHPVGGVAGLALQVSPGGGARTWIIRIAIAGKRRDMGLGGFPSTTLAGAREKAREARAQVAAGVDPIAERRAAQSALRAEAAAGKTFDQCVTAYVDAKSAEWRNAKHRKQWSNTLKQYASPVIGGLLVRDVTLAHVMKILEPIWKTKTETASRLRQRLEAVLNWATVRGYRSGENPARWKGHLENVLAAPKKAARVKHHPALPIDEVPAFMVALRGQDGLGARALELAILAAARSGEVRGATWAEIDLEARVWTVPAERMKMKKEHRVPLSPAALKLLREQPRLEGTDLLFPSPRLKPLSDMTLSAVLRRMEVPAVPHGFRSTFRDWAAERTNYPRDAAEMALAHAIGDKTEAAYRRGDLFDKRRRMMNDWAAYCGGLKSAATKRNGASPSAEQGTAA